MKFIMKSLISFMLVFSLVCGTGCSNRLKNTESKPAYHAGTWTGKVWVTARLAKKVDSIYWNAAWKLEGNIRLDEYSDGSIKGIAECDYYEWNDYDSTIKQFINIAVGRWDKFTSFIIELKGQISESDYSLNAVELPRTIPDVSSGGGFIEFWDFLYPASIEGKLQKNGTLIMSGESKRPQGKDLAAISVTEDFREFEVTYSWSISRL